MLQGVEPTVIVLNCADPDLATKLADLEQYYPTTITAIELKVSDKVGADEVDQLVETLQNITCHELFILIESSPYDINSLTKIINAIVPLKLQKIGIEGNLQDSHAALLALITKAPHLSHLSTTHAGITAFEANKLLTTITEHQLPVKSLNLDWNDIIITTHNGEISESNQIEYNAFCKGVSSSRIENLSLCSPSFSAREVRELSIALAQIADRSFCLKIASSSYIKSEGLTFLIQAMQANPKLLVELDDILEKLKDVSEKQDIAEANDDNRKLDKLRENLLEEYGKELRKRNHILNLTPHVLSVTTALAQELKHHQVPTLYELAARNISHWSLDSLPTEVLEKIPPRSITQHHALRTEMARQKERDKKSAQEGQVKEPENLELADRKALLDILKKPSLP